ncbi:MAG: M20 family metallopeptidase [Bacillota bacterium]|nr:M20 family metallopeptidase [Bacillota bacterium]
MNINSIMETVTVDEVFALTSDLVKIPSYTGLINQELAVARYIKEFFETENIEVFFQDPLPNRPNVIAIIRGCSRGKSLMLSGHLDTVPPYYMIGNPFSGNIEGGKLYGRGSCDMKGALACMMATMAALRRSGTRLAGDLIFAGVINEEQQSEGTEYIVRNGPGADAAIVGEPTGMEIAAGHRGLEWIDITVIGKTTHGGTPTEGVNAISKAARLIYKIETELIPKFKERRHPLIGEPMLNFGVIKGGDQPSSVAGFCRISIDRRWPPLETFSGIVEELEEVIAELQREDPYFRAEVKRYFEGSEMMLHKPLEIDLGHPVVKSLQEALQITGGKDPKIVSFPAWTDASLLSNYAEIPSVVCGPGFLKHAHTENEHIDLSQLEDGYRAYTLTALDFCGREEALD